MFAVPDNVQVLRDQVLQFVEERVYPHEAELQRSVERFKSSGH